MLTIGTLSFESLLTLFRLIYFRSELKSFLDLLEFYEVDYRFLLISDVDDGLWVNNLLCLAFGSLFVSLKNWMRNRS